MPLTDADIKVIIAAELKKAGFDKAKKATFDLEKSFKRLGKAVGLSLSTAAIVSFGKQSLKAFADDDKAARRLTQTLGNMGLAFEDPRVKAFISNLEATSGVLDDQLRPAMQALLTTTGSVQKSQELLSLALDVSAGSGESVITVAGDLSKAYVGVTKGLVKYNLGLSRAELTSKSFSEIQQVIATQFAGQNAAYLDTYAGKISLLNVAFQNAKETIGKGLADAFLQIAGNGGIGAATDAMAEFSQKISDAILGMGVLIGKINSLPKIGGRSLTDILYASAGGGFIDALAKIGERQRQAPKPQMNRAMSVVGSTDYYNKQERDRIQREKDAEKRAKALAALQKKAAFDAAKRERQAQQLKRAGSVFDMENIQIVAALQNKVTEDQRLRLTALLAINTDNATAADNLTKAILALQAPAFAALGVTISTSDNAKTVIDRLIDAQTKLFLLNSGIANIPAAKNPFDSWTSIMAKIMADLDTIAGKIRSMPSIGGGTPSAGGVVGAGGTATGTGAGTPLATALSNPALLQTQIQSLTAMKAEIGTGTALGVILKEQIDQYNDILKNTNGTGMVVDELTKRQGMAASTINVYVQGSVISEQDLASAITDIQYTYQRAGQDIRVSSTAI